MPRSPHTSCFRIRRWPAFNITQAKSCGRSSKSGYRVSVVRLQDNRAVSYKTFITGWMSNELAWGRPADVLVMPDGSLLVSDDHAGAIYRIIYRGQR